MKEINIYIKKENLGKPNWYSTTSQRFFCIMSTNEGKIMNVFWNVQRQSDVSQLWHGLIASNVIWGCSAVHSILLCLEWLTMFRIPLACRDMIWKGCWIKKWLVTSSIQPVHTWALTTYLSILDRILVLIQNKPKGFVRTVRPTQAPKGTGWHPMLYPYWQHRWNQLEPHDFGNLSSITAVASKNN